MTAASAFPPDSSEGRSSEPSMEDILASIRRIIADDQTQGGNPPASANGAARRPASPAPASAPVPARSRTPYDDVLDLARLTPADRSGVTPSFTEQHEAPAQPPAALEQAVNEPAGQTYGHRGDAYDAPISGLRARLPEPQHRDAAEIEAETEDRDIPDYSVPALSHDGDVELLSAPLGESVMSAFETLAATVVLQNTPMLERVMRDLLRPMLKTWLDDNLPSLVERLVRSEIERVARGTRG
ncbi:MAG: PopZ family protein [Janthinobacterium lividum]